MWSQIRACAVLIASSVPLSLASKIEKFLPLQKDQHSQRDLALLVAPGKNVVSCSKRKRSVKKDYRHPTKLSLPTERQ